MLKREYLDRLIKASPVELYLSAIDGARLNWPWRMHPPKNASTRYRDSCETYVIDSDPEDNSVTVETVLDTAHRLDADVASLQDIYQDCSATVDQLLHDLEVADDHAFDGTLLLPLQRPYVRCWTELGEPTEYWIGLGGLKDGPNTQRIEAAKHFRSHAGWDIWLHGFGWGPHGDLAVEIRNNPTLLDSIDYSSPMQNVRYEYESGEESMSVAAMKAGTELIRDLRRCTDYINETETVATQLDAYSP